MFKSNLTNAVLIAMLGAGAIAANAAPLDREQTRAVFTGATGTHWFLGDRKWYRFNWGADGTLTVTRSDAKEGDEPFSTGKWRVKEVEKKEGMSAGEVDDANAELQFVYCQQVEKLWSGRELCWETHQATFDVDADKKPLPTQEYKFFREAGAETGAYIVTRR